MHTPSYAVPMAAIYTRLLLYFIVPVCIIFYGAQIWVLQHYRAAFTKTSPPLIP